jgi:hypothetical protein
MHFWKPLGCGRVWTSPAVAASVPVRSHVPWRPLLLIGQVGSETDRHTPIARAAFLVGLAYDKAGRPYSGRIGEIGVDCLLPAVSLG